MSTAILTLSENGDLQRIHDKWLTKKACSSPSSETESDQLELGSFWGLFLIFGIACLIALLIYLCMVLRKFSRHLPEVSDPSIHSGGSRSARLQTFLSFVDEKERGSSRNKSKRKRTNMTTSNQLDGNEDESRNGSSRIQINIEKHNGDVWTH